MAEPTAWRRIIVIVCASLAATAFVAGFVFAEDVQGRVHRPPPAFPSRRFRSVTRTCIEPLACGSGVLGLGEGMTRRGERREGNPIPGMAEGDARMTTGMHVK